MASSKKTSVSKKLGSRKAEGASKLAAARKTAGGKVSGGGAAKASRKASTASPVSFAAQIAPMFRPMDVQCMRSRGVFLKNYDYMKDPDHANQVLDQLKPDAEQQTGIPRMPFGGPYWTDGNIALFQQWINDGLKP